MQYLASQGLKFGTNGEGDLHRTFGHKKTYYMTESRYALKLLENYRQSRLVEK